MAVRAGSGDFGPDGCLTGDSTPIDPRSPVSLPKCAPGYSDCDERGAPRLKQLSTQNVVISLAQIQKSMRFLGVPKFKDIDYMSP